MGWVSRIVVLCLCGCATAGGEDALDAGGDPDGRVSIDANPGPDAAMAVPCVEGDDQVQSGDTGNCYMYFQNNVNWNEAQAICQGVGADVFLASITSAAENALVAGLVPNVEVWLGASDQATEGEFVWLSGEDFTYDNWRAGEPNNGSGNEDCITYQDQLGGVWDDRPCGDNQRVVCERN